MARKKSLLEKMKTNPKADWGVKDLETLCDQNGLNWQKPSNGSHYKISSPYINGILTIPSRRPIKPVYIRHAVGLCEAHMRYESENRKGK